MAKYGFSSLNNNLNQNANNGFTVQSAIQQSNLIKSVRVLSIVLDETHPRFKELGEWNALGVIEYEDVNNPLPSPSLPIARPLTGNFKNLPLINEIVYLLSFPDTNINTISSNAVSYYINIVSLWNHPHHNAYPTTPNALPPTQQKDYVQTQTGNVRRITDQSTEIFLGKTFKERSNIHPILPFEGDIIYEGRWGNSIRIGSTVKNTGNTWSSVGENGDPVLIIRNGQGKQIEQGWIPTIEDINNDDSSVYLTSTQKIPLKASSTDYTSYTSYIPKSPNEYEGKQILINSGRLVFNSTTDHIMLSSALTISFNAVKGFNFDTNANFTIQSRQIKLGSKSATEPLLLGNQTINLLNQLINNLSGFMTVCSTVVSTPPGVPLIQLNVAATQLNSSLKALQANLEGLKSKSNYTI